MTGKGPEEPGKASASRPPERGVGVRKRDWIANQLKHVYDEALEEEIPPEMLALLSKLDDATGEEGEA